MQSRLPPDSLGHHYASGLASAGGQPLPDPVLEPDTAGDDTWLHQRVRRTHDLWHDDQVARSANGEVTTKLET